jgi:hypothetical protein
MLETDRSGWQHWHRMQKVLHILDAWFGEDDANEADESKGADKLSDTKCTMKQIVVTGSKEMFVSFFLSHFQLATIILCFSR